MGAHFMAGYQAHVDPKVSKNRNVVIKDKDGGELRLLVVEGVEESMLVKEKGGKRPVILAIHGGGVSRIVLILGGMLLIRFA